MPENITVSTFLSETWDDYNSPTTSTFVPKMGMCRNTVNALEETLDYDRSGLTKTKKAIKALYNSGNMHVANEAYLAENLEKLGASALSREHEGEIGAAFLKFAVVTKELSALMKNLMQNLNNIVMFPLDSFLKGDLKGVKGDLKKPFDKSYKEYDTKFKKIEKEKLQIAREAGLVRTEVSGPEVAEEMEKERTMFQLQMCEYLIKVNEIKTKKGVDLLQHLVEYYQAQTNYFQDGMKTIEHFNSYIEELVGQLSSIKQRQDLERRKLIELRDQIKTSITAYKEPPANASVYNLHQLQGNKAHGFVKHGYLLKKSEGKMRKVWQKRRISIKDGIMSISHSDESKEPVKLNLLTCQVKLVPEDVTKKCFDLISSSKNRTYHFQADDHGDMEAWISVLNNAKEAVLMQAVGEAGPEASHINQSVKELTQGILQQVKRLPGNRMCCDCGAPDPEWLSVNLGVLICLECCGVHRDMGVHISRTQSIVIDNIGTAQLLLARNVSNRGFNDIMEATLDMTHKPTPSVDMEEKKEFIRAKYERHRYAIRTCTDSEELKQDLKQAVLQRDIYALLQVYAEGVDLMAELPDTENGETALHLAILAEDGYSLHLVDFIAQNTNNRNLEKKAKDGSTALHLCAQHNQTECMKLLLRLSPELVEIENANNQTAMDIAREMGHESCVELLKYAITRKAEMFEQINTDWCLIQEDQMDQVDYSDDDLDMTPERRRSRPPSLVMPGEIMPPMPRERSMTSDSVSSIMRMNQPPPPPPPANKPKIHLAGSTSSCNSSTLNSGTLKRKGQAPAPPGGHSRNPSDSSIIFQGDAAQRPISLGDPPPLPLKEKIKGVRVLPPEAKFVLPPPPEFRTDRSERPMSLQGSLERGAAPPTHPKPVPAPRASKTTSQSLSDLDQIKLANGQSRSSDSLDSTDSGSGSGPPRPTPRMKKKLALKKKRCKAIFDCEADNDDELTFKTGDVIIVTKEEDEDWWAGELERDPSQKGMFPVCFVHLLND